MTIVSKSQDIDENGTPDKNQLHPVFRFRGASGLDIVRRVCPDEAGDFGIDALDGEDVRAACSRQRDFSGPDPEG